MTYMQWLVNRYSKNPMELTRNILLHLAVQSKDAPTKERFYKLLTEV